MKHAGFYKSVSLTHDLAERVVPSARGAARERGRNGGGSLEDAGVHDQVDALVRDVAQTLVRGALNEAAQRAHGGNVRRVLAGVEGGDDPLEEQRYVLGTARHHRHVQRRVIHPSDAVCGVGDAARRPLT